MYRRRPQFLTATLLVLFLLPAISILNASETETKLLATIEDQDAPLFDRMFACKQLATEGSEKAIPVLVALLDDDQFAHYARYGLEPIPSPKVDEALIEAMQTLSGSHLIGVIYSLANRGKPEAIDALVEKLSDSDEQVASAAAHSIARLGTLKAGEILGEAMSTQFANAGLVCGRTLADQGHVGAAVQLLVAVKELDDTPQHIRQAAMLQAINVLQSDASDMLSEALAADDEGEFLTALRAARLIPANDAAEAVRDAASNSDLNSERTVLLIQLLGDLKAPISLQTIVDAAKSNESEIRIAAIEALASLGTADHVSLLLEAADDDDPATSAAAMATLSELSGAEVDAEILSMLDQPQQQRQAIDLVGERQIVAAVPILLKMVDGEHEIEVIKALGETIELENVDVLGKRIDRSSPEVREAARTALHAVCYRQPDRDQTAATLAGYLDNANEQTVAFLMNELRVIGGDKALALVAEMAMGQNELLKDYATRSLGEWLDTSAAPILWKLAETEGSSKYGIRGTRGYIRLARQFAMDESERAAMCQTVLESDARDAEKMLVLDVLSRYPNAEMLDLAVLAANDETLKPKASETAMEIAKKIGLDEQAIQEIQNQMD